MLGQPAPTLAQLDAIPYSASSPTAAASTRNADVYACVRCLSDAASSIPLIPYRETATGRVRFTGPLADLLDRPAPATSQANLVGQLMTHLCLWGNAFLAKYRDADGRIEQLGLISPDRVAPALIGGQALFTITEPSTGRQTVHDTGDIIHIRSSMSLDGLTGLSPIRQCRVALDLSSNLASHAAAFFHNGARPSGILSLPAGASSREAVEVVKATVEANHTGTRNAHRIMLMQGDVTFTPIAGPLDDLQFAEQRRLSTQEIARIFRVPPRLIGAPTGESMHYSNAESAQLEFVQHSLRPWLVLIEQAITNDRDLSQPSVYAEFLIDALLRADSKTRAEIYTQALNPDTGWMTRSEVRQRENLDPEIAEEATR